jgi:hypothetical protein
MYALGWVIGMRAARTPPLDAAESFIASEPPTSETAAERADAMRPIVEYVSRGRGFVDVEPYPDAAARAILGRAGSTPEGP